jgi:hypothetical protein
MKNAESFAKRGLIVSLFLFLVAGLAFGQNLIIGADATFTGSGTYNVKGNIDNNARTSPVDITGTVNLNGTAGQAIGNATKPAVNFATLKATAVSTKTFNVNSTVSTLLDVAAGTTTKFDLNGKVLTLEDAITNTGTAVAPFDFNTVANSEVIYAKGSGNQTIFGTTYQKLTANGAATFNLGGAVTTNAAVSHTGGALTVNEDFTANSTYSFATIANVSADKKLEVTGGDAGSITTVTTVSTDGTIRNSGGAELTIATLSGNAGTIEVTNGSGTIAFTNAATNSTGGLLRATASGAELRFNDNLANSGTISLSAGAKGFITGSFTAVGSLNLNASSDWTYNGTDQDVAGAGAGVTYGNLFFTNNGTKTALGNITLQATSAFDNGGADDDEVTLDMGTFTLSIPSGTKDNTNSTIKFGGENNGVLFTTGTINYNRNGNQNIAGAAMSATAYENLLLSVGGSKTVGNLGGDVVATTGNLTVNSDVTLNVPAGKSVNVGTDGSGNLIINGSLTNAGTVTVGE